MFTSCCPGWVRFVKRAIRSCRQPVHVKSPQQMFGAIAKTYYAKVLGVEPERLFVVSVMPCSKKAECALPSMVGEDGTPDVDVALTVREMVRMMRGPRERGHAGRGAARHAAGLWHGRRRDLWRHGRCDGSCCALGILPGDG
ncbi:MAG: [Fe-Fe] hydrogenase large subunit C-terminal domain-containing protein [Collinsella sp.]